MTHYINEHNESMHTLLQRTRLAVAELITQTGDMAQIAEKSEGMTQLIDQLDIYLIQPIRDEYPNYTRWVDEYIKSAITNGTADNEPKLNSYYEFRGGIRRNVLESKQSFSYRAVIVGGGSTANQILGNHFKDPGKPILRLGDHLGKPVVKYTDTKGNVHLSKLNTQPFYPGVDDIIDYCLTTGDLVAKSPMTYERAKERIRDARRNFYLYGTNYRESINEEGYVSAVSKLFPRNWISIRLSFLPKAPNVHIEYDRGAVLVADRVHWIDPKGTYRNQAKANELIPTKEQIKAAFFPG